MAPLRFSVVIPTYQRRDVVVANVAALAGQEFTGHFDVVVVVDGSTDGTAEALRALRVPFSLTVIEQPNQGASKARNRGAHAARGEIVLFLDDDMESDPHLLVEHERSHRAGADAVLGHMPLHPDSPPSVLTRGIHDWAERRKQRLSIPNTTLTLHDLLTGQMSLRKEVFERIDGFDTDFTCGGTFGNEDVDFGYRLQQQRYHIVFNPAAISWQKYVVKPRQYLRQYRQAGRADVIFARKHPEQAKTMFKLSKFDRPSNRLLWGPLVALSPFSGPILGFVRWFALRRAERNLLDDRTSKWFRRAKRIQYLKGVREAGGVPRPRTLRVLAYHSISDLSGDGFFKPYAISPAEFGRQLDALQEAGYQFVSASEALYFLCEGGGLPRRPILLTFDDCYQDLLDNALPLLRKRNVPAVAFAVTGLLGQTNTWDVERGAPALRLLDALGLKALVDDGLEIGAHSRTHKRLPKLSAGKVADEVAGSVSDLEQLPLPRPRFFSYPYGESNESVRRAVQDTGMRAAFAISPGFVCPGGDTFQIPRIEILREDTGWKLRWKVAVGGKLLEGRKGLRSLPSTVWQRFERCVLYPVRRSAVVFVRNVDWLARLVAGRLLPSSLRQWLRARFPKYRTNT
jgi:peptidoglycan/xylan/chitin deacetylase (PgdA/CDA1 family)/GT2 family glycosyltransferase